MAKRQKIWARKERERLMKILRPVCVYCGATECLTFDCIKPQGHEHHTGSTDQRMVFYRRQFRLGNLCVACSSCNAKKADKAPPRYFLNDPSNRAKVIFI